jgi:hypothetical protein
MSQIGRVHEIECAFHLSMSVRRRKVIICKGEMGATRKRLGRRRIEAGLVAATGGADVRAEYNQSRDEAAGARKCLSAGK